MSEKMEYVFKMGDLFKSESPLSRFILKLAMVRNDMLYIHAPMMDRKNIETHIGKIFYYIRIGTSHYRESMKLIQRFHKENEIISFINELEEPNRIIYDDVLKTALSYNDEDSFIKNSLRPIRDYTFHYYDHTPGSSNEQHLMKVLNEMKDEESKFIINGYTRNKIDYYFADEVSYKCLYGSEIDEQEVKKTVQILTDKLSDFIGFSDDAVAKYISDNAEYLSKNEEPTP